MQVKRWLMPLALNSSRGSQVPGMTLSYCWHLEPQTTFRASNILIHVGQFQPPNNEISLQNL